MSKGKPGAKLRYADPAEMQKCMDAYFAACEGHWLKDERGRLVMDRRGRPVKLGQRPPTVAGLSYALGFATRKSLWDYGRRKGFNEAVAGAKLRIEAYNEERLFEPDGYRGAVLTLRGVFKWGQEQDHPESRQPDRAAVCIIPAPPDNPTTPPGTAQDALLAP